MRGNKDRLLVIDDEKCVRDHLAGIGRRLGFEVATAGDSVGMVEALAALSPTIVLMDLQMPGSDGIKMLKIMKEHDCESRVVLISGMDDRTLATATQLGGILGLDMRGALQKPIAVNSLRKKLSELTSGRGSIAPLDLKRAIENGEIRPAYQPKLVQSKRGQLSISEVEALARWHRPDSVVILPSEFIGMAEDNGLMPALTWSLLRQVAVQLAAWAKDGISVNAAVNVSPAVLTDTRFPDKLKSMLEQRRLAPSCVTLEITESAVMQHPDVALEILTRLRILGFGLAIDDFGTGYSSLEQLYRMPFSELKVDRFLVREMLTRSDAAAIVEAIIALGHKLGMKVCAEGVESPDILAKLQEAGCNKFQGYLIGRPLSADIFERRYQEFDGEPTFLGMASGRRAGVSGTRKRASAPLAPAPGH